MRIFIIHAAADAEFAKRLSRALASRGIEAWSGYNDVLPGSDVTEVGYQSYLACDGAVVIVSPALNRSEQARSEIALGVFFLQERQKFLIPVLVHETDDIPFFLRKLRMADFREEEKFEAQVDLLVSSFSHNRDNVRESVKIVGKAEEALLRSEAAMLLEEQVQLTRQRLSNFETINRAMTVVAAVVSIGALGISFFQLTPLDLGWLTQNAAGVLFGFMFGVMTSFLAYFIAKRSTDMREVRRAEQR